MLHSMPDESFGSFMRSARVLSGLTQVALAERMGVVEGTARHWEREYAFPAVSRLPLLADLLEVDLTDLEAVYVRSKPSHFFMSRRLLDRRTHCPKGHEFAVVGVVVEGRGGNKTKCRACAEARYWNEGAKRRHRRKVEKGYFRGRYGVALRPERCEYENCRKPLDQSGRKAKRFCNGKCASRAKNPPRGYPPRKCKECRRSFKPKNPGHIVCSSECSLIYQRRVTRNKYRVEQGLKLIKGGPEGYKYR